MNSAPIGTIGNERLGGLDGLRGIAALCVLGYHVHTVFGGYSAFAHSYLAVDVFFMLSGYVMARTYEVRFAQGLDPLRFFLQRMGRLFLPMAAGATIGLVGFAIAGQVEMIRYLMTLFFIPDLTLRDPFSLNRPTWSIFYELVANLAHAAILWRCRMPVILVCAVSAALILFMLASPLGHIALGNQSHEFIGGFARVGFAYCLGVGLFRWQRGLPGSVWLSYALLVAALLWNPGGLVGGFFVVGIVAPALIMIGSKRHDNRAIQSLGALSFPLYAVHYPILEICLYLGAPPLAGVALSLGAAALVTRYLDLRVPFEKLLQPGKRQPAST